MDGGDQEEALTEVPQGNMTAAVLGKMEVAQFALVCMMAEWGPLDTVVTGLGTEAEREDNWGMVPSAKQTQAHIKNSVWTSVFALHRRVTHSVHRKYRKLERTSSYVAEQ